MRHTKPLALRVNESQAADTSAFVFRGSVCRREQVALDIATMLTTKQFYAALCVAAAVFPANVWV